MRIVRPTWPAFLNRALNKAVMNKARLSNRYYKYRTKQNWENYRIQRNLASKLRRKSVRTYFSERCEEGADPKEFWKTVRPFFTNKGMKSSSHIQLLQGDDLVSDPHEVANVMNRFYTTITADIGEPVNENDLTLNDVDFISMSVDRHRDHSSVKAIKSETDHHCHFDFKHITPTYVNKVISKLDTKKATGHDKLPAKLVRAGAAQLSGPLSLIVNNCFNQAKFPTECKLAEVSPLYKKDNQLIESNYRPVSILTCLSKIIEICMNNQLKDFNQNVLSSLISAYRPGYSCQYSLMKLVEDLRQALDKGKSAALLLMDLSKAFDCLPHDIMAAKLKAYGMSVHAVRLLINYLRHRKQRVKIGEHTSEWMELLKGVPQGSILGPSLFNLFVNDFIFFLKNTDPVNYADDNTLEAIGNSLCETIQKLRADADISLDWFDENSMKANPNKFQFMVPGKDETDFSFRDITLKHETFVNLLGISVDQNLDFKIHVNNVCRKAGRQLNALRRKSKLLNQRAKTKVFHAFIQSNFNYCPLIWVNQNKTDLSRLEKVQERTLRLVYNDSSSDYCDLLTRAKISSVFTKWQRLLVKEMYKALNGI